MILQEDIEFVMDRAKSAAFRKRVDYDDLVSNVLFQLVKYGRQNEADDRHAYLGRLVEGAASRLAQGEIKHRELFEELSDDNRTVASAEFDVLYSGRFEQRVLDRVYEIINNVPENIREVFTAYYVFGLETKQIAERFDKKVNHVNQMIFRGRKTLSEDEMADLGAWDTYNREVGRRRQQFPASKQFIATLRSEGWL